MPSLSLRNRITAGRKIKKNVTALIGISRTVESVLPVLELAKNTSIYQVWMQAIRSKICGEAYTVLELYGTDLSWEEIKSTLLMHYNDKRDEISLTRDLFKLTEVGTVEEFYSKISHIISLMVNQLNLNEQNSAVRSAKSKYYQDIGLKVFVAGLKEPIGPIVRAQAPKTL